ncbi:hypothetical protein [Ulvibacterium marinum]|uniref:Uncharacterized protein n=1 Tax=Ulvibacterium marinum TaxID=2419782 RepID=A0A3B0BX02_9FLAO|nr:hypothetical protein [Ulvibacterium marinum]RKN77943.1 hypothetical protein D7Z94_22235 [Ulvibacterium marinum]
MKKSKKLIYSLILVLFIGIVYNASKLKNQFDKIDKTDEYWEYPVQKALDFSHIRIEGGNRTYSGISPGTENKLFYKSEIESQFKYSVVNDTLIIEFDKDMITTKVNQKQFRRYKVLITYAELKSISTNDSYLDFGLDTMEELKIETEGFTTLKIESNGAQLDTLNIEMSENAFTVFRDTDNPMNVKLLKTKLVDSSFIDLTSIKAETFLPEIFGKSEMGIGSGLKWPVSNVVKPTTVIDSIQSR